MTNTQSEREVVLKVDTEGRVRTPREKRAEILVAYGVSGMTGQQFAACCGVKYPTLRSWVGKARRASKPGEEAGKSAGMSWVEATLETGRSGKGEGLIVEIGSGVRMEVINSRQAALAGEVIRALGGMRPC
ncbi:hypothetical protein IT571_11695 [Candidatus Sumerlaeota bacterium]|nr:hypothetical protein [Candidatus Sumerlaeota bacterium]